MNKETFTSYFIKIKITLYKDYNKNSKYIINYYNYKNKKNNFYLLLIIIYK
jgi:hypothetical protein